MNDVFAYYIGIYCTVKLKNRLDENNECNNGMKLAAIIMNLQI